MKRELRQQIMKRMVRNLPNLTPFMVGAAVGAVLNRRDTKKLAGHVREDLRAAPGALGRAGGPAGPGAAGRPAAAGHHPRGTGPLSGEPAGDPAQAAERTAFRAAFSASGSRVER